MNIPVKKLSQVFTSEIHAKAKEIVVQCLEDKEGDYDDVFVRYGIHNHPFFKALHRGPMLELAKSIFGEEVKASYCFLSMYQNDRSICPLHTDRPQCKFSIDLCISQGEKWEIFINDQPYLLDENEALVYSGTDHPHYRNLIKKGNHCNLVFFHFVPSDFVGTLD